MQVNKLMIVAHPDDETLFGGGELLRYKGEYIFAKEGKKK